ncbi:MAG: outer membrane protein assembly factor BamD [Chthoniobacterales bacterium]
MSRWFRFSLILVIACVSFPQKSPAPVVFREGEGMTTTGVDEEPVELKKNAAEQMKLAEATEAEGNLKKAVSSYRVVVKRYPRSDVAAHAQFKVAQLTQQLGDANRAFAEYQKMITKYPKSTDFEAAIEGQFNIAKLYLDGKRLELFGVPTLPSMVKAEEMFTTVITNAPFSAKYASAAQFDIGQARERQGDYKRAIEAYQKIIDDYPYSEMADDAQYQIGYVYMKASREGEYDQSASIKAREAFEDFIYRYPNSEKVAQAKQNMATLGAKQTDSAFNVAQFYDKQKNYKAAAIYYNEVIKTEPDSPNAKTSQERLSALKAQVGEDKLTFAAPAQNASKAKLKQKMQAQVDTTSRPDFVGPALPEETPAPKTPMRTSPDDVAPVAAPVEPALPTQ